MEKIRNLSIKKTIVLYMTVSLMISFFLSAVIVRTATDVQQRVWLKYVDQDKYYQAMEDSQKGYGYEVQVPRISHYDMTDMDVHISETCDFLETYTILLMSVLGTVISVILFYHNKIKIPLEEMENASNMISENELDFTVAYENKDELGQLCIQFEKMRKQLEENNRTMWKMIEQEKALRAAIAHDIRSPLAILKGYQEMLLEFVPQETLDKEKIMDMLQSGMGQIERIHIFLDTMRKLSSLEEREIEYQETNLSVFTGQIEKNVEVMGKNYGKKCTVTIQAEHEKALFDPNIISEVLENLLSNALRYADSYVIIEIIEKKDNFSFIIKDDGSGFMDSQEQVTKAYYHANPQDGLNHFGLGLYISRIYCEKHGGQLLINNRSTGGAEVKAVFATRGTQS